MKQTDGSRTSTSTSTVRAVDRRYCWHPDSPHTREHPRWWAPYPPRCPERHPQTPQQWTSLASVVKVVAVVAVNHPTAYAVARPTPAACPGCPAPSHPYLRLPPRARRAAGGCAPASGVVTAEPAVAVALGTDGLGRPRKHADAIMATTGEGQFHYHIGMYYGLLTKSARISMDDPISARPPEPADSSGEGPKSALFRSVCGSLPRSVLARALAKAPPETGVATRCAP
jgi:hypothetical protein